MTNSHSHVGHFFENGIRVVKVTDWLDWAISTETKDGQWVVVLPMIQRGSVWKPHQVIDLWDTILRGMPFGGLMASCIPPSSGMQFFRPLDRKLVPLPANGGLSLIDGQQRTLAMLVAWPSVGKQMQRRIWVDLGEDDNHDHLLRLHLTSESSPMGYERGGPSGESIRRMALAERRQANSAYADRTTGVHDIKIVHDEDIAPWHSTLALDLRELIESYRQNESTFLLSVVDQAKGVQKRLAERIELIKGKTKPFDEYDSALRQAIIDHLERRAKAIREALDVDRTKLERRIRTLANGLKQLFQQHFPIIEVREELMRAEELDEAKDPPLAVLFKRIGTGGTDLKSADYVFSVIKHLNPECHRLVETQLGNQQIAAIYTATNLVMSAVRITAAKLDPEKDHSKLDKAQFTRLLRGGKASSSQGKEVRSFLEEFNTQIASDGDFVTNLRAVLKTIAYRPRDSETDVGSDGHSPDIGLPLHALSLVQIPALEVILCWLQTLQSAKLETLQANRLELIRFLLSWHLAVPDATKASRECFKIVAKTEFAKFPEQLLFTNLTRSTLALPIRSPTELLQQQVLPIRISEEDEQTAMMVYSSDTVGGLRGWRRFVAPTDARLTESERLRQQQTVELYRRWWNLGGGYSHTLLLWLQRDYIHHSFVDIPAQPGMEDDTPYDFDHICPYSHWGDWRGGAANRLIDFHAEHVKDADHQGHYRLGNAIGNVRVWDSSRNRSDGDRTPSEKLNLMNAGDATGVLRDSAITNFTSGDIADETQAWILCGPIKDHDHKIWEKTRALAFQKAIELRTFNLYQRFYADLKFAELTAG